MSGTVPNSEIQTWTMILPSQRILCMLVQTLTCTILAMKCICHRVKSIHQQLWNPNIIQTGSSFKNGILQLAEKTDV